MLKQTRVTIREDETDFVARTLIELQGYLHKDWRYSHTLGNYNYYVLIVSD